MCKLSLSIHIIFITPSAGANSPVHALYTFSMVQNSLPPDGAVQTVRRQTKCIHSLFVLFVKDISSIQRLFFTSLLLLVQKNLHFLKNNFVKNILIYCSLRRVARHLQNISHKLFRLSAKSWRGVLFLARLSAKLVGGTTKGNRILSYNQGNRSLSNIENKNRIMNYN